MKRMYVVLAIMFAVVFCAGSILAQQSSRPVDDHENKNYEKIMKMRAEMHRRMMDKLINGVGPDQNMFGDMEKMMDEVMSDSFNGRFAPSAENFKMEWSESGSGRTLTITPKDPKQKLDINIEGRMIIIKGMTEQKTVQGSMYSNFTNSFNVPDDCDASKVKMDSKDGKILMQFPFIKAKPAQIAPQKDERKPLPPSGNEVQI